MPDVGEFAPAKVNLTLHVLGRRPDGYHEIESLVAFADIGDRLTFVPGDTPELAVRGPNAKAAGPNRDNLVLKATRLLGERVKGLEVGSFTLDKELPVAAGLGGGSSDAAAALRLLAKHNGLLLDDPRLHEAARLTGADVPVCLDPRPRMMRGTGEILGAPLTFLALPAVLVNPGASVPTRDVFAKLSLRGSAAPHPRLATDRGRVGAVDLFNTIEAARNDLEPPAIALQPVIADVLAALRESAACALSRMSGSGATCFGLFDSRRAAKAAAKTLSAKYPRWWVRATELGPFSP